MKNRFENLGESDESKKRDISFEKGNTPEDFPPVLKTENPIDKGKISLAIQEFIYKTFPDENLRSRDFSVEFLCFGINKGFLVINVKSEEPKRIEANLRREQLEEFILLLNDPNFGDVEGGIWSPSDN